MVVCVMTATWPASHLSSSVTRRWSATAVSAICRASRVTRGIISSAIAIVSRRFAITRREHVRSSSASRVRRATHSSVARLLDMVIGVTRSQ